MVRSEEIYAYTSGIHGFSDVQGLLLVSAEHNATQSEFGIICQADGFNNFPSIFDVTVRPRWRDPPAMLAST